MQIHDTSYGGSSDEEDFFSIYYQSAAANALLYAGLGTTVIGLVIWFVGTGEKGFKTLELRLIGPTLIAVGLFFCVVRVLLCICPSTCFRRRKKTRLKNTCPHRYSKDTRPRQPAAPTEDFVMVDQSTSLLTKNKKRVSIAPNPVPCTSTDFHGNIATTSVFLQNEQERNVVPKPIPTIEIPDFADFNVTDKARMIRERDRDTDDSLIELQNIELSSLEVSSVSSVESVESDSVTIIEADAPGTGKAPASKLKRARQPKLATSVSCGEFGPCRGADVNETCLSTVDERSEPKSDGSRGSHSGIVLSPSKLGQ